MLGAHIIAPADSPIINFPFANSFFSSPSVSVLRSWSIRKKEFPPVKYITSLPVQITDSIAVCLYTGMATDTGCFQYDNAGPETHRAVAALMEICPDVRYAWINRKMFAVKSFGRLQLDKLLIDHLECYLDGKCVLICVSQEFLKKFHVDEAELEGIAGFPLQVEGAEIGITMKEKEAGKFRISMRSADQVNVSAICQRLGGGGHVKAAGCQVEGTADEVRRILLDAVKEEWGKA